MRISHYVMQLDFNRNELYDHPLSDISDYLRMVAYSYGQSQPFQAVAPNSRMTVEVNNADGHFNPEKSGAKFNGLWTSGIMGRFGMYYYDNANMLKFRWLYQGRLVSLAPHMEVHSNNPTVLLTFEDAGQMLIDGEVIVPFAQNIDTGSALILWAQQGGLPFPYPDAYALLDVPDSANLDVSAKLVDTRSLASISTGNTVLRWLGDAHDRGIGVNGAAYVRDILDAEMGGRFWYHAPAGGYYFRNRNAYINLGDPEITLSNEIITNPPPIYRYLETIINRVDINFTPREVVAGGIVFTNPVPIRLNPLQTRTINARYVDPDNKDTRIAAIGIIPPTAFGDYTANLAENGTGADRTASLLIGLEPAGQRAVVHLQNTSNDTIYVTKLQLRAQLILRTYSQQTVTAVDPYSIALHGERKMTYSPRMVDSAELALQYAQSLLLRFAYPHGRFEQVSMWLNVENNVIPYTVNNIIAIDHPFAQNNTTTKYRVAGEIAQIDAARLTHLQTWVLEPVDMMQYAVLEDANRGRLDMTARLGF